ncbi:bifunctional diaminohydroxyphosphoribosylaminopyrimidine deaminase/5-amino-6-(5-phosphoribosylamino)uracil reductase RibD [Rhizobium halophytocola]|nr:bifunctional diaminohydroxyphosphoribosylaminopyrimidine deaminase/5-amino-6-(5-phosphoribosylamino)uracil reductase RibD [Rhizobium halophytocola]
MGQAIALSLTHLGQTSTNPSVGCIVVKDGEVVGRAVTAIGGRPHAEPQALAEAGEKARGATVYVTLEPCSHFGRTPPCADALIVAGVARVVVALSDPDTRVSGRGLKRLEDAGILVETGVLKAEAARALAGYLSRQTKGRPYVILKLAVSADGMLGRRGTEIAITGPEVKAEVHRLRAKSDAILVGSGTALADDPELTVRLAGLEDRSPFRIVLDRDFGLSLTSKLVRSASGVPVAVVSIPSGGALAWQVSGPSEHTAVEDTANLDRAARRLALEAAGVEVMEALDLRDLLHQLAVRGVSTLMVEGGAQVAAAFRNLDLVDRIDLYTADMEIGAGGIESPVTPADIPHGFALVDDRPVGKDRLRQYERAL